MANQPIKCKNPACAGTNTRVRYRHYPCGPMQGSTTWTTAAVGPDPDGVPMPQPCPGCGTQTNWEKWWCNDCGYQEPPKGIGF